MEHPPILVHVRPALVNGGKLPYTLQQGLAVIGDHLELATVLHHDGAEIEDENVFGHKALLDEYSATPLLKSLEERRLEALAIWKK